MVFRVRKYIPMGPTIIAAVNASNLYITALQKKITWSKFNLCNVVARGSIRRYECTRTYAGTAGVISESFEMS